MRDLPDKLDQFASGHRAQGRLETANVMEKAAAEIRWLTNHLALIERGTRPDGYMADQAVNVLAKQALTKRDA